MIQNEVARAALEVTRKWATDELEAARARVTNLRCGGKAYNDAIEAIHSLAGMIDHIGYILGDNQLEEFVPPVPAVGVVQEPLGESLIESGPAPVEPEPEPEKPVRVVDLAEVRTKAKAARDAGVKLADVWAAFDATKLSEVPHEKYGEVLDLLDEMLAEPKSE